MIRHQGENSGSDVPTPSDALARRGRLFFVVACGVMVLMAATAALQVLLLLFRVGDHAGMMSGGFAFIVTDSQTEIPTDFVAISRYAIWQSTLAAGLLTLRLIPGLVILSSLMGLFRLYARRLIFTAENEVLMRRIAWALVAYAVVPLVTHATLYVVGMSPVAVKLELRQLDAAVLGIILFAFVNVVAFGSEIERDRAGFF